MEKKKHTSTFYFITAALAYVCSVIWFCNSNTSMGILWLSIGSLNLCLAAMWLNRENKKTEEEKEASEGDKDIKDVDNTEET